MSDNKWQGVVNANLKKAPLKRPAAADPNHKPLGKNNKDNCEDTLADSTSISADSTKQYAYCSWCKQMWSLPHDYPYEGNWLLASCPCCEGAHE
eukprot:10119459-Karenia_brevis.AAC.1